MRSVLKSSNAGYRVMSSNVMLCNIPIRRIAGVTVSVLALSVLDHRLGLKSG
jgi:hypothetical protein